MHKKVLAAYTGWADSRNKPTEAVTLGDGTPLDAKAMAALETFVKVGGDLKKNKSDLFLSCKSAFQHERILFLFRFHCW